MRSYGFEMPPSFNLGSSGAGQPLPTAVLQKMEQVFGTNFSDVRTYVGPQATSIGALAFTMGTNIYFAPGHYNPHSAHGQRLLGHELAHVVQQRSGRVRNPFGAGIAVVQDPGLEAEAERLGLRAAMTPPSRPQPPLRAAMQPAQIQRKTHGTAVHGPGIAHHGKPARVIQRTKQDALETARIYAGYQYRTFADVLKDKYRFTEKQWGDIVADYNRNNRGVRLRFVYEKPQVQDAPESVGPRLSKDETQELIRMKLELAKHSEYESFLYDVEMRVRNFMGMGGFVELYRGGHIILNDRGVFYAELVKKYGKLMKPRLTTAKQTSHYTAGAGYDVSLEAETPQMGVDLPEPLTAHVLFGIVPEKTAGKDPNSGNTFIQTETYGFQNFYNKYVGHAIGFLVNVAFKQQSGMAGKSMSSEKSGSAAIERD